MHKAQTVTAILQAYRDQNPSCTLLEMRKTCHASLQALNHFSPKTRDAFEGVIESIMK